MSYIYEEILNGITKVPTPNFPSTFVVTGESQPIFTGSNSGEVILAAAKYGDGKILVISHDCYFTWLNEKAPGIKRSFMENIKRWLTGEKTIIDSDIVDLKDLINKKLTIKNYKIVKWLHTLQPKEEILNNLLDYINEGGSLICGGTIWSYLNYPNRALKDLPLYDFLKKNTGVILTGNFLRIGSELDASKNQSKYSQFDRAIEQISVENTNLDKYYNTILIGLDVLCKEGSLSDERLNEIKQILIKYSENCNYCTVPKAKQPIKNPTNKNTIKLLEKCLVYSKSEKASGIEEFPGDFKTPPELLTDIELSLTTTYKERLSTGYYLPAGVNLLVNVISENFKDWSVRVGAHTDDLTNCDTFKRWPCVSIVNKLEKETSLFSPFGGLIYLESPGPGEIKVNMANVVESPYFDLTVPSTIEDWNRRKNSIGLWGELGGENIIFTAPSSYLRELENPTELVEFWDQVVRTHHELRGTDASKFKRERVVNDRQPSHGSMHAGYPIVTNLNCCEKNYAENIYDIKKLKSKGCWGLFHEIGHNMQRAEWTFDGAVEVTVNILSMHAIYELIGKDVLDQTWPRAAIPLFDKYFSKQPNYENWKSNACMALMPFLQLIKHFGWDPMHKFMKQYEDDINNKDPSLPKTNQDKIDQWVIRYSKLVSRNIKPQFEMFGLPVSNKVDDEISELEPWCPIEEKNPNTFFSKLEK